MSDWLKQVQTKGRGLPSRLVLHGVEGVGKSSFGAFAPSPIFIMGRGETGLETLIDSGQLPEIPHLPELQSWPDVLAAINEILTADHKYRTLVIDTLNSLERLCHEEVCRREFANDWGEKGFVGWQRGFEISLADWRVFLALLDRVREERQMAIIALCHTKVGNFTNPEGPDFDRYMPDLHKKTWGLTHKWADLVLFANFETQVQDEKKKKSKGVGGQDRIIYTERHAAWDAKNRHGLPPEISMGNSGKEAWNNFLQAMQDSRRGGK